VRQGETPRPQPDAKCRRPASTLVEVSHLVDPEGKLEIDAVAFL